MTRMLTTAAVAAALLTSTAHADFTINLNPAANMTQESQDGFRAAADFWESQIIDDVEVNIDIDFRTLAPNVLGSARSFRETVGVADYFTNLTADATSRDDLAAIANLPTLGANGSIAFRTQTNTESTIASSRAVISLDNDTSGSDSLNNRFLSVNRANLKAVGLFAADSASVDAEIAFSDSFSWDFDRTDGISSGAQDFVGVAIHEIGHALGFVSGVDTVDFAIENQDNRRFDLDRSPVFSAWDMFRYSDDDGILDLSVGTDSYFSLDGGETNLAFYSTGSTNGGDGRQASHWKDGLGLGIMDPTAAPPGNLNIVTDLDLMAFDVMGWDLAVTAVPEPSSGLLLGSVFGLLALRRKRSA
jgi:hypothetical protein